ncbi:Fe2+-dependent dioxygenase [Caenispirillum salinarum]|uniref:Fe2+-dependent dioxygenase n=1 Tax=Caenispirillum salinarum TaxID=859058 RepID=UPI00384B382D
MLLCIADVLSADDLAALDGLLESGDFQPGTKTAGWNARLVKKNEQMAGDSLRKAQKIVLDALNRNATFSAAAVPKQILPPLVARYSNDMTYGNHVDDSLMRGPDGRAVRTDVSTTVFISAPEDYEGGELTMETTAGTQRYKLPRGAAIVYPSTTLHRVEPVTAGERRVAVTWTQSLVRDPAHREMLFDLERARRTIFDKDGKTPVFDLLSKTWSNLMREWAEP